MIFPKRGQVWTYKERARFYALCGSLPLLGFLGIGIFYGLWQIILLAVLGLAGASLIWLDAERKYRDEP